MEAVAVEGFNIDGELESLLGMFNFDQCSSNETSLGLSSSLCNENVFCSDSVLIPDTSFNGFVDPFVAKPQGNIPVLPDHHHSSNHHDLIQDKLLTKRKLNMANLYGRSIYEEFGSSSLQEKNLCLPRKGLGKPKKKQKVSLDSVSDDNDEINTWQDGPSLSNCNSSSDDEKALGEVNIVTNSKGKARASKGTATDPQSLYARKRRERINERLKTLQTLVPNGTKVDISTMLEEAVHYVKFLQLQIKLLSSDDLWMYAPLAYNGLDMGLHHSLLSRLM